MRFLFLLLALPAFAAHTLVPHADVEEQNGSWSFVIHGETDLPDGASIEVDICTIRDVVYPDGEKYVDESPISDGKATAHDRQFSVTIGRMPHAPYSVRYRAKLLYDPGKQLADVASAAAEKLAQDFDFTYGAPADYERERAEADKSVADDFGEIHPLLDELERRFKPLYTGEAAPDLGPWDAWRKEWDAKRAAILDRNRQRMTEDIYWRESYGKRYIEAMLEDLSDLADFYRGVLAAPTEKRPPQEEVAGRGKYLEQKFWERIDGLQISLIGRPSEVLAILDEVDVRVKKLVALRAEAAKDASKKPAFEAEAGDARLAFVQLPAQLSAKLPETYFALVTKLVRDLLPLLGPPEAAVDLAPIADAIGQLRKDIAAQGK